MGVYKLDFSTQRMNSIRSDYNLQVPSVDFATFANEYLIRYRSKKRNFADYRNAVRHFIGYQRFLGVEFKSNDIGGDLLEEFAQYLISEKGIQVNTASGVMGRIKFILRKASMNGWSVDYSYTEAKIQTETPFKIALNRFEISQLYFYENLTDKEKQIRDLFVLCCQTSLRYSDASRLTREHFKNDLIEIKAQKTKEDLYIPIDLYVNEIFERYDYSIPQVRTLQHFNYAIKKIAEKAGLNRTIMYERVKRGKVETVRVPLYKLIASHTGRRSFVSIRIAEGWSLDAIAACTGHRSFTTLMKYDKTDKRNKVRKMAISAG